MYIYIYILAFTYTTHCYYAFLLSIATVYYACYLLYCYYACLLLYIICTMHLRTLLIVTMHLCTLFLLFIVTRLI